MTDKCRKRMNGREEYITTEITQSRRGDGQEKEGGPEKGRRLLGCERSWGFLSSSEGSLLLKTLDSPILCVFHPQNKPSPYQSPTFGPTLYKFIVMGSVQKPWPYNTLKVFINIFLTLFILHFIKGKLQITPLKFFGRGGGDFTSWNFRIWNLPLKFRGA